MKKREFEKKIKDMNLDKLYYQDRKPEFSKGIYEDNDKNCIYGCYFDGEKYVVFFKDTERSIIREIGNFTSEDEAYDKLFEVIKLWSKKYNK